MHVGGLGWGCCCFCSLAQCALQAPQPDDVPFKRWGAVPSEEEVSCLHIGQAAAFRNSSAAVAPRWLLTALVVLKCELSVPCYVKLALHKSMCQHSMQLRIVACTWVGVLASLTFGGGGTSGKRQRFSSSPSSPCNRHLECDEELLCWLGC